MDSLISRNAAIDAYGDWYVEEGTEEGFIGTVKQLLERLPSAQPEIIRCKDCKHRIEHKHYGDLGESAYTCEGNMVGWILPNDFCSYAERRTDG